MRKLRFMLLAVAAFLVAAALPRPSAAAGTIRCEILCWTAGNQTCWQTSSCTQHCCLTSNPTCVSACEA